MSLPRVAVLLATHNGQPWIEEQIESILAQQGVEPFIFASDDLSTDRTIEILERYEVGGRVQLLARSEIGFGNANRNFMRLITDVEASGFDYVALSDQDDIWLPEKLLRAVQTLRAQGADAYSGNVTAFWENGREQLAMKSHPQRLFDYVFEAPGPGCTFVFAQAAFSRMRAYLKDRVAEAMQVKVHDWPIYAYARVHGWRWVIDDESFMRYRQHASNEAGLNKGFRAIKRRYRSVASGTFRMDTLRIASLVGDRSWVIEALSRFNVADRVRLCFGASEFRRKRSEQWLMRLFMLTMRRL